MTFFPYFSVKNLAILHISVAVKIKISLCYVGLHYFILSFICYGSVKHNQNNFARRSMQ
jgi:hypothetical protein